MRQAIPYQLLLLLTLFASCLAECTSKTSSKLVTWKKKCKHGAQNFDLCNNGRGFCYRQGANPNNRRLKCFTRLRTSCGCFPDVANGYFVPKDPRNNTRGATAELNCYPGYRVDPSTTITCNAKKTWSLPSSVCEPVDCGSIPSVQKGSYVTMNGTLYPAVGYLVCDEGFVLTLSSPEDAIIRCEANGDWNFRSATCQPVDCGNPPTLQHGTFNASSGTAYLSEAFLVCDNVSVPANENLTSIVCESSGDWSAPQTTCVAPGCPMAISPPLVWLPCVEVSNMTLLVMSGPLADKTTATSNCQSVGDLARIDTPAKMTALQDYLNALPEFKQADLWIQGTHNGSVWHFTNGDIMPADNDMWYDADASSPCVLLKSGTNFRFDDRGCWRYYGYICEISE